MALIPIFDELGNITRWEETMPAPPTTGTGAAAPPPTTTTPPPRRIANTYIADNFDGTSRQGTLPGEKGPVGVADVNVKPSPAWTPPSSPTDSGDGGDSGTTQGEAFIWPEFDPGPAFQAPAPFRYDDFRAPTLDEAKADPGYEFARSEGLRGLQNSAASRGVARTGGTLKDLIGWGNRFAEQNYGNVFNRNAQTYDRNRNNAADAYQTNYGISRDVWDRGYAQRKDVFAPKQRAAELTFQDLYARWKAELDANTNIATAGAGL